MRDYFRENFQRDTLQPDDMYILQHEKQRRDEWRVAFDHNARLVTTVKRNSHGRTWIKHFSGGAPNGPFSGAMLALSQPLKVGETYTFDIFSGGNRYVFQFKVIAREQITTTLGTFATIRIEPSVLWLSEGSFRSQASETTIWVTDDSRHLPVTNLMRGVYRKRDRRPGQSARRTRDRERRRRAAAAPAASGRPLVTRAPMVTAVEAVVFSPKRKPDRRTDFAKECTDGQEAGIFL